MRPYEKIETVFNRDVNGTKHLIFNDFRNPTVRYLVNNRWVWTEKIDGTNISVHWDGYNIEFHGRTAAAQIPAPLVNRLNNLFNNEEAKQLFEQTFGEKNVILYGEGYGRSIQNGGNYDAALKPEGCDFILYDLLINDNYQAREDVERCAKMFNIPVVPIVGSGTLYEAIHFVKQHPVTECGVCYGACYAEGIVCRPEMELRDRCGNRVIVKIKWEDFKDVEELADGN